MIERLAGWTMVGYSRFHSDRHIPLLLNWTVFGSIRRSGAKEAQANSLRTSVIWILSLLQ